MNEEHSRKEKAQQKATDKKSREIIKKKSRVDHYSPNEADALPPPLTPLEDIFIYIN